MIRFLTLMLILVLVLAHGSSVAAAICRHQDSAGHVAALESKDAAVAAEASGEESAGKASSKQGRPADSGAASLASDMLPAPGLPVPFRAEDPLERIAGDALALSGASIRPLLEPPSA